MKIGVSLPVRELENDLGAIREFAEAAEALGYTHLRVPDQVIRPNSGHLHEPMTLLSYIAAITKTIELVPSVIVLPLRQTALLAKQAAELDLLSNGRLRLGVGVGASEAEFTAMGQSFRDRGRRCDEQMEVLKRLWCEASITFRGNWHTINEQGLNPLPIQRPIPMWIGAQSAPAESVIKRIGAFSDGWFVLAAPEQFPALKQRISDAARAAGRDPAAIGQEAGVAVVGPREAEWQERVRGWRRIGLSHLCLRTLGGELPPAAHVKKLQEITPQIPGD